MTHSDACNRRGRSHVAPRQPGKHNAERLSLNGVSTGSGPLCVTPTGAAPLRTTITEAKSDRSTQKHSY
eukprot:9504123-Pyramimonas_sp.AAC.1